MIEIDNVSFSYTKEKNTLEDNTKRLEYALQTMFDFWLQNLKITVEE